MITFSRLGGYGRLGNQMFQYAALRGTEAATGYEAKIPPEGAPGFRLDEVFALRCPRLEPFDRPTQVWQEQGFAYQPGVFAVQDGTDLIGYFQSDRYFAHIAPRIRAEFAFRPEIASAAHEVVGRLRARGAPLVSLHVRRGDYLTSSRDHHHVCGLGYYDQARRLCPPSSLFVVCSDDADWCRGAFRDWNASICETDDATTLAVMMLCDHNIIAASSFSWWGAWLNPSPSKLVIAPYTWFGPALRGLDTRDLLPASWQALDG